MAQYRHDLEWFTCCLMTIGSYLNPNALINPEYANAKGVVDIGNLNTHEINICNVKEFINASWYMDFQLIRIRFEVVINPYEYNKTDIRRVHEIDRVYKNTMYINIYGEHQISGVFMPIYGIAIKFDEFGYMRWIRVINSKHWDESFTSYINRLCKDARSSTKMIAHEIYRIIHMWTIQQSKRITKFDKIGRVTTIKYRKGPGNY